MNRKEKLRTKAGFTLLEMMIVLAIIGISVAMALTQYIGTMDESKVRSDVRALEQAIQVAKMHAITENISYGIVFDRDTKTYFTFRDNAPAPDGDGAFTDPDSKPRNNVNRESNAYDWVVETRWGGTAFSEDQSTWTPHRLSKRNRFTCIFNDINTSGTVIIMFDSMGCVTPDVDDGVTKKLSVVMIQTDTGTVTETKPRGFVHIDTNTGMTESRLSQSASTANGTWCITW